ncbi:hypothetical protein CVT26_014212 [Gymnopilus dilepis]|uniref:Deacetylase sirtuin-type domain-containing protein n=1 Tax=Gymnopilus dilepis TaxID=231916 RepID=A0A409VUA6_9AGAR|nr:hypothetical protein CVT26_014212 [Gymnopilus dilepis]
MRISVPGIPQAILNAKPPLSVKSISEAIQRLTEFIGSGDVTLLTGAGVSVDSGIRAYRGEDGRYMNPNYKPILYHELVDPTEKGQAFRQRYWLRSYLGYPPVRDAQPNTTHFALAALQRSEHITRIVTQVTFRHNVDGLHHKALRQIASGSWDPSHILNNILELHGTLHVNADLVASMVAIEHLGVSYKDFVVPDCPECVLKNHRNSVLKPEVIFFGESIPQAVKERSFLDIEHGDRLLLIGTTLATYSAFRLLRHALELKKPVMLLNVGPTRADGLPGVEKIDVQAGLIMRDVAKNVVGTRATDDLVIAEMLRSGVLNPLLLDDDDRRPRATG